MGQCIKLAKSAVNEVNIMKVIVITGANGGIGIPFTERLLELGNTVVAIDIQTNNLCQLKEKYQKNLEVIECDVTDEEGLKTEIGKVYQKLHRIDIAIHGACKVEYGDFYKFDNEEYKSLFEVNYYGALNLTRAVLDIMKKQRSGKVYYFSSSCAIMGIPYETSYACSKAAIETLAKCLAIEYGELGLNFYIIQPPMVATNASDHLSVSSARMKDPKVVGRGLGDRLEKNKKFILTYNSISHLCIVVLYLFHIKKGRKFGKYILDYRKSLMDSKG